MNFSSTPSLHQLFETLLVSIINWYLCISFYLSVFFSFLMVRLVGFDLPLKLFNILPVFIIWLPLVKKSITGISHISHHLQIDHSRTVHINQLSESCINFFPGLTVPHEIPQKPWWWCFSTLLSESEWDPGFPLWCSTARLWTRQERVKDSILITTPLTWIFLSLPDFTGMDGDIQEGITTQRWTRSQLKL